MGPPRARDVVTSSAAIAVLAAAAVGWAMLRLSFGGEYEHAPFTAIVDLSAPLPFGHRVLVPLLVRAPIAAGVPVRWAFGVVEALSAFALLEAIAIALRPGHGFLRAHASALVVLSLLVLTYVAPRTWPVFYPWDTPALAVIAGAVAAAVHRREGVALALAILGALNRESAVLVPAIYVALRAGRETDRRGLTAWAAGALGAVVLVRLAVSLFLPDNPGPPVHFTVHERYRLLENLSYAAEPSHWPRLLAWGGFVLPAWAWLGRRAGFAWRRLGLPAAAWAAASSVAANVYEPRAFGEAILLGLVVFASGPAHEAEPRGSVLRAIDRYGGLVVLAGLVGLAAVLARWPFLPVAQWPMPK